MESAHSNIRKICILLTVLLSVFAMPSSISGVAIALPYVAADLGSQALPLQWVVNAFNVFFASFTLIWGALSDRFGAKKCLLLGMLIFLTSSFISFFAQSLYWLNISRAFAGIGGASIFSCGSSILVRSFSEKERVRAFALFGTTAGLGITLGPTINGFLIDWCASLEIGGLRIGWRSIFAFDFIVTSAAALISPAIPKDRMQITFSKPFDLYGAVLFTLSMFGFILFISSLRSLFSTQSLISIILCLIAIPAFIFRERRLHAAQANPLLDLALLANRRFLGFSLVPVVAGLSFVVLLTYFPTFLMAVLQFQASQAGLCMLALTLPMLFCPLIAGRLLQRGIKERLFSLIICLMMSLGLFLLISLIHLLPIRQQILPLLLTLFIIGCGMGLHAGIIDHLALSSLEEEKAGIGAGLLNSFRLGSESAGAALYGVLLVIFIQLLSGITDSRSADIASGMFEQSGYAGIFINAFSLSIGVLALISTSVSICIYGLLSHGAQSRAS